MTGEHVVCSEAVAQAKIDSKKYADSMQLVYDGTNALFYNSPEYQTFSNETFDNVKTRLEREWASSARPEPAVDRSLVQLQTDRIKQIRDALKKEREAVPANPLNANANELYTTSHAILTMLDNLL